MFFTTRQLKILQFIRAYIVEHEVSPTLEEVASQFQISRVTAHEHIKALEKKGALRKSANQARSILLADDPREMRKSPARVPIAGRIVAGAPVLAEENRTQEHTEEIDLATWLPSGRDLFALEVHGESMIDDGIHDKDVVILERRANVRDGEIVVALLDSGETTLKRIYRERDGYRLQPSNPTLGPLFVPSVQVQGVMIGLLRRY